MTIANPTVQSSSDPQAPNLQINAWKTGFISSPAYDLFFFILSPLLALTIIMSIDTSHLGWAMRPMSFAGQDGWFLSFFIGTWTWAHLIAVVFRSHANPMVFKTYRGRFIVVPIVLFLLFNASPGFLVFGTVVGLFWDVYHTAMQNFGFCRIYDSKLGNSPTQGRRIDMLINLLIYIGPIFIGSSFRSHLKFVDQFMMYGWNTKVFVDALVSVQDWITLGIVVVGVPFIAYYIYAYWRMSQEGYRVSPQKILLMISTAIGSIWAWAFLHPLMAFFVANFFHGLQYFAIVWRSERRSLTRRLRLPQAFWGYAIALVFFLGTIFSAGLWYQFVDVNTVSWAASVLVVVSLMHFWYDGFIWSVRKKQV